MQIEQPSPEQCDAGDPLLAPSGYKAFACWYPERQPLRAAVVYKPGGDVCVLWTWTSLTAEPRLHGYRTSEIADFWQDVLARQTVAVQIEVAADADDKS